LELDTAYEGLIMPFPVVKIHKLATARARLE